MLKNSVIEILSSRYGSAVKIDADARDFAIFVAKHPEVGDVVVEDDGEELIVSIGNITHGHFGSYEPGLTQEQREAEIAQSLADFLDDMFADRYYLHRSKWSGGWTHADLIKKSDLQSPKVRWFRWSGPVRADVDIK